MCIPVWTVPMGCWNRPHTQKIQVAYIYIKILGFFQMIELHILLVPQVRVALLKNYLHWLWNVNCVPAKWVFWDFFVHSTQNNTSYKFAMRLFGYIWEKIIFLPTKTLKTSIIRGELDREHQFLGIVRKKTVYCPRYSQKLKIWFAKWARQGKEWVIYPLTGCSLDGYIGLSVKIWI